jgi:glycine dehydrogenase
MTTQSKSLAFLEQTQDFIRRHIGPNAEQTQAMLNDIGAESVDALSTSSS